jgi:hypothetical protein
MVFAGEHIGQLEPVATPKYLAPVKLAMAWRCRVQKQLHAVTDIEVAVEMQLALADMTWAAQP